MRSLLICVAALGCGGGPKAGTLPAPVSPQLVQAAQATWPDATEASLAEGRELFVERCKRCHVLPDRRAYAETKWPKILDEMAPKAKLDAAQRQLVERYILVERR